eukprot:3639043-Prymnesium_polylepis.1
MEHYSPCAPWGWRVRVVNAGIWSGRAARSSLRQGAHVDCRGLLRLKQEDPYRRSRWRGNGNVLLSMEAACRSDRAGAGAHCTSEARRGMVSRPARAERRRLLRRRWKRLMRALRGNTPPPVPPVQRKFATSLSVVFWNAQSMAAKAARARGAGKADASSGKWEWLRAQYERGERPTIIVLGCGSGGEFE